MLVPVADDETRFYWDGLRRGRLLVQRCSGCDRHRFPPMPACPFCGAVDAGVVDVRPSGTVYSWVVVHRPFSGAFADDVPYVVATIELGAGCRILARVDDAPAMSAGLPVEGSFVDHDGWTELRFRPA